VDQPTKARSPLSGFRVQFGVIALATAILAVGFGIVFLTSPRTVKTKTPAVAVSPIGPPSVTTVLDNSTIPTTLAPVTKQATPTTTESPRKSLTELSAAVVQIRRFAASGEACSNSTGVVITADGLILTSYRGIAATPGCDNPDLLIAFVDGTDSAPKVRFRGHVAGENAAVDLAVVQIDRDSQGRRVPLPALTPVELSHAVIPVEGVAVRTLAFSQAESATLSVLSGTAALPSAEAGWLNLTSPIPSGGAGAGVFDISGHLVGIVTQAGWNDTLTQARPIALAGSLLQRVGVDSIAAAGPPPTVLAEAVTPKPVASVATGPVKVSDVQLTAGKVAGSAAPLPAVKSLPGGSPSACIFWTIEGVRPGMKHGGVWAVNGLPVTSATDLMWNQSTRERTNWCWPANSGPLPSGTHTFRYSVEGKQVLDFSFTVGP
jgi:Trypsin-like peptidase domain